MTELPTNDYISQINRNGSGLNIPQIVGALVDADIDPIKAPVEKNKEKVEAAISGLALLKKSSELTNANIEKLGSSSLYTTTSSNTTLIGATVTDSSLVKPGIPKITDITQLAIPMSFSVPAAGSTNYANNFNSPNATLPTGYSLTIKLGTFVNNGTGVADVFTADTGSPTIPTLTLASGEDIQSVARKLNDIVGLSAKVVQVAGDSASNDQYKIQITGEAGLNNGFEISTASTNGQTDARIFDVWNNTNGTPALRTFDQYAQNLNFKLDGLTLTRESNTVSDAIPGVSLDIKSTDTGSGTDIKTEMSKTTVQETVQKFIDEINAYKADLTALTRQDKTGAGEHGELYGDHYVKSRLRALSNFMNAGLAGYDTNTIHMASLGFKTQMDGTYTLDQRAFDNTFKERPEYFSALVEDKVETSRSDVSIVWSSDSKFKPHYLQQMTVEDDYDAGTGDGSDNSMYFGASIAASHRLHIDRTTAVNGVYSYGIGGQTGQKQDGSDVDTTGFFIRVPTTTTFANNAQFTFSLGRSFTNLFKNFHDEILNNEYEHRRQESNYEVKRENIEDRLTTIELRSNMLAQSYNKKFQAMEESVTGFNSTGNYLNNFITQWNES